MAMSPSPVLEVVDRQAFDLAAALGSADRGAEFVLCESVRQLAGEPIGRVGPQIFAVIGAVDSLLIIELVDLFGVASIGKPHQHMRHAEPDIPGITLSNDFHLADSVLRMPSKRRVSTRAA